jgi:hypothetical protein
MSVYRVVAYGLNDYQHTGEWTDDPSVLLDDLDRAVEESFDWIYVELQVPIAGDVGSRRVAFDGCAPGLPDARTYIARLGLPREAGL